ncbi:MAG: tRNA pseudouridine(55) synthase TruB [SAR86 cluster bacterium]|uniref:tRNA pseudouridine synthase B n=1 Tax=SAR86 cluster bacterium TaxID=2030880 RepID=A0A520MTV3_9GAMM|nr:MAG: tRNA pseudouridine(55) synthase TruB [SAR86 cluster bacterium]
MNGFLLVNKGPGITSSRVVQIVKKKFQLKKVGHLGTLDPMATGLLIIALNRATKFASLLLQSDKSYRAEVTLGIQTDTDDAEGEAISSKKVDITELEIKETLLTFLGASYQLPPDYSALKHKGKPMYKYARDGIKVEKAERKIFIKNIQNILIEIPKVSFDISCSKGTYIRSIARDLGAKLGCGAHLSGLIRTSQEKFMLSDACSLDDINLEDIISLEKAFEDLDFIKLNEKDSKAFIHGRSIERDFDHTNLLRVYDSANQFIAIGKNTSTGFKHEYLV